MDTFVEISNEKPMPGLEKYSMEFCLDRNTELQKMRESISINDFETIQKLAHKWKCVATPYGFNTLEILSILLEESCKSLEVEKTYDLIDKISVYLIQKRESLNVME